MFSDIGNFVGDAAGKYFDGVKTVGEYFGGNLQNAQDAQTVSIERAKAKTAIELQQAAQNAEQQRQMNELVQQGLKYFAVLVMVVVVVKYVVPSVQKIIK